MELYCHSPCKIQIESTENLTFTSGQLRGKAKCMISPEPLESACQWVVMEKSHDNRLI